MRVTFVCPSGPRPVGGVTVLYEFANALSRRGHEVHLLHGRFFGFAIEHLDELSWFSFEPDVSHHLVTSDDPPFPPSEVIFGTGAPASAGLPVHLVQGQNMLMPWLEQAAFEAPALRVCVASWLVDAGLPFGVPADEFHVVHMGIDHERYRLTAPIGPRPPQVAMLHHAHEAKGTQVGLAALTAARAQVPELRAALFGTAPPTAALPEWASFQLAPEQRDLVDRIYNASRIFLQPSDHEGFGLTAVEAMACGCALVTTDNGGSSDYARPGVTALVAPPRDVDGLAEHIVTLLRDDEERQRLAEAGVVRAQQFGWDAAGEAMEAILLDYVRDPVALQSPGGRDVPT